MKTVKLSKSNAVDRVKYIEKNCVEKSVLHLGCVDSPFLKERLKNNTLLHKAIMGVSKHITGVDLDEDGLKLMAEVLNIGDLYKGNIEILNEVLFDSNFDIVVASEIIEHINNPGLFFNGVKHVLNEEGVVLITVPNALNTKVFLHGLLNQEKVHPDHNYYFTPVTLQHLIETNGFQLIEMFPYWCRPRGGSAGLLDRALGILKHTSPWVGEGIVVLAKAV